MENGESSVATGDAGVFDSQEIRLVPDRSAVETACEAALVALAVLFGLLTEAPLSEDRSIALASFQLDMTLAGVRGETCATLADVRAKLCVFRQLGEIFPPDDPQFRIFVLDLARDIADFLENPDVD